MWFGAPSSDTHPFNSSLFSLPAAGKVTVGHLASHRSCDTYGFLSNHFSLQKHSLGDCTINILPRLRVLMSV